MSDKFRSKFRNQLNSNEFQSAVTNIVRNENFVKDWFRAIGIHHQVTTEINNQLPGEITKVATPIVERQVNSFALFTLPQLVNNQITSHLENSKVMSNILSKHTVQLENKLQATATDILTKVVNEPKFNTLSNMHFAAIDTKNNQKLQQFELNINKQFEDVVKPDINVLKNRIDMLEHREKSWQMTFYLATISACGYALYNYMQSHNKK
jgi:hypothetical protein